MYLRPEDFRKIQCGYKFHLKDREFEEDESSEDECDCKERPENDPEGYFEDLEAKEEEEA